MQKKLTLQEAFSLGVAYSLFTVGDLNGGIHATLPGTLAETKESVNRIFQPLHTNYSTISRELDRSTELDIFRRVLEDFAQQHNLKVK